MPKTMKARLTNLSLSLKVDTDLVEMQIEDFLDEQFERQDVLPGGEMIFNSKEPVSPGVRNEIVKRYRSAGYVVNDYTEKNPKAPFRLGLGVL